jgi:hypothetical protein
MSHVSIHKTSGKFIVMICFLLLLQTSLVWAADEITGDWEMMMDNNGRKSYAMLSIKKAEDGTLTGKWGSTEISNAKFEDGKLTFIRTIGRGDREFTTDYEGTLKDGKLMLTISNDWGEFSAVGTRPKPMCPALGQWDINFSVGDMDINAKLTVSQTKEGTLEGKWTEQMGEHKISDVKFKDGKLTFTRSSKVEDMEFENNYEGTVKDNKLTGMLKGGDMAWEANGQRIGQELIGTWELTTVSDFGERKVTMRVFPDMTGRYEVFDSEIPMKNLKLEGNQVTFMLEMGFGDMTFELDFKGKLEGKTLKGQMDSDRGTSDVTGKKLEKAKMEKPAKPAAEEKKSEN